MLLLNKPLPEEVDEIKSSLLCVRFGSGHVVPVTLWKDHIIRGEHIPSESNYMYCVCTVKPLKN